MTASGFPALYFGRMLNADKGPSAEVQMRLYPIPRKPYHQLIQLQLRQLPPIEDRLDDLWRQWAEPQNPTDVGGLNRPGLPGGRLVLVLRCRGGCLQSGVVVCFGLGGRSVSDRLEETTLVEPMDPFQGGELDGLE
jgi:hypothetical protein